MKRVFAVVYVLVLVTQLPHVFSAYASLEQPGWFHWTAWGAAVAFELSIAVFTYRIVVERSTRRSTRWGLGFFLVASAVANATYYGLAPLIMRSAMPVFATLALPCALGLFASEFGAEVRREERRVARMERAEPAQPAATYSHRCESCGRQFAWPAPYANSVAAHNALNAHLRAHASRHAATASAGSDRPEPAPFGGNGNGHKVEVTR